MALTPLIQDDWMDSLLMPGGHTGHATLTFTIKVYLARHPATTQTYLDSDNQQVTVQSQDWDASSSSQWSRDLKTVVEDGWNSKLWLIPSSDWRFGRENRPEGNYRVPCIACRLEIDYVPRAEAHVVINSYRLNRDQFFRSSMEAPFVPRSRTCSLNGGETIGTMDTNDLFQKTSGQIAALHEFGHYIGLSHVNAPEVVALQAAGDTEITTNSPLAYGRGDQRLDLMGAGTLIAGWHSYPWCRRLRRHLGGTQPNSVSWHHVRGATPTWLTGMGIDEVFWQISTRQRSHVEIDYLDLYRRRTDWMDGLLTTNQGARSGMGRSIV